MTPSEVDKNLLMDLSQTLNGYKIFLRTRLDGSVFDGAKLLGGIIDNSWRELTTSNHDHVFSFPARLKSESFLTPCDLFGEKAKDAIITTIKASEFSHVLDIDVVEYIVHGTVVVRKIEDKKE